MMMTLDDIDTYSFRDRMYLGPSELDEWGRGGVVCHAPFSRRWTEPAHGVGLQPAVRGGVDSDSVSKLQGW